MSRIAVVGAVAVALAVTAFAGIWGSHGANASGFQDGVKCYRVRNVSEKGDVIHRIYVADQFTAKDLIVKDPISFCARAEKPGGSYQPELTDLLCYAIKYAPGQQRFHPVNILAQDQFYGHFFGLTKPYSLCESAQKSGGGGGTNAGRFLQNFTFMCYKARYLEHSNPDDEFEKFNLPVIDQFGEKDVRIGRPSVFCTQVIEKKQKAKNDHREDARVLTSLEFHTVSTVGAGRDRDDPPTSCAPSYGHSVWYTFTPASDQHVALESIDSTYDTVVTIYRVNGDDLVEVACNDDFEFPISGDSKIETKLQSGVKYLVVVGAYGGDGGGSLNLYFDAGATCASCDFSGSGSGLVEGKTEPIGDAAGTTPLSLVCYSISQRAPDTDSVITSDQLGAHLFDVGRGVQYCTPAGKCIFRNPEQLAIAGVDINYCKSIP